MPVSRAHLAEMPDCRLFARLANLPCSSAIARRSQLERMCAMPMLQSQLPLAARNRCNAAIAFTLMLMHSLVGRCATVYLARITISAYDAARRPRMIDDDIEMTI